jgi:hypothetical protein
MKSIVSAGLLFVLTSVCYAQIKSVGLIAGGGYTVIDVQKVNNPIPLTDWNNYSLVFKGFVEYQIKEGILLGLEAGRNRLYFWEYKAPGYSYYNWRTEWTSNAVFYLSKQIGEEFFIQAGAGIHSFYNGTVFGLLAGVGTSFHLSEKFAIPLALRIEPIFGAGTPVAINIGTGVKYNLK